MFKHCMADSTSILFSNKPKHIPTCYSLILLLMISLVHNRNGYERDRGCYSLFHEKYKYDLVYKNSDIHLNVFN